MAYHPMIFIAAIFGSTAVLLVAMGLISRHISQRRLLSQSLSTDEIARRLERIEQTVEATAIEVERLGESNRFVARLLAARTEAGKG